MSNTFTPFKTKRYLAIAREPVYVGTGGYRIGRVDNTIIRDSGTNIPKIPGTTISGNARYYSWLGYKSGGMEDVKLGCAKGKYLKEIKGESIPDDKKRPCGICPVCLSYGYATDEKAYSGLAYFSDARILFFPVATMIGTVWVTSDEIVKNFIDGYEENRLTISAKNKFLIASQIKNSLPKDNTDKSFLNFGWIMLELENEVDISLWKIKSQKENSEVSNLNDLFSEIENKVCIVSREVFHHIVNSNLETRTSVSINPVTGAAESGALFTYEALPRGTVFIMDVSYENPKNYDNDEYENNDGLNIVIRTVEKGFELFSSLGIGGMGTRGFGKIEIKGNMIEEKQYWESVKRYLENLKGKYDKLKTKLDKVEKEKKEKIYKKMGKIIETLKLHQKYMLAQKEKLENQIENFKEICGVIASINITVPENCNQNNAEEEQNGQ